MKINLRFSQNWWVPVVAVAGLISTASFKPDEGMFPLNYLNINDLKNAGIKLQASEIFNPGEVSLTDALVRVGGCTGSFISDEGLIITNHHCVYGSVARLSNSEHNYLENGFVAKNKSEELSVSMPCKITQSYEDVSALVLDGITDKTSPEERANTIAANIKRVLDKERAAHPELTVEISEMFVGKSYTLFRYITLMDVRLVMAPPLTVGQFGGDSDNWEWPRHNGDFSLVRAYVDKNGKPAPYSPDNVPYKPKKTLKINPNGTQEGDFVFIMGYPGRTFRHESGQYLQFQQEIQLPVIQNWYKTYIDWMKEFSKTDVNKRLAFAGKIQGLENTEKNYRGKIQGLRRTSVVQNRQQQDVAMRTAFPKGSKEDIQAQQVLDGIDEAWNIRKKQGRLFYYSNIFLNNESTVGHLGLEIVQAKFNMAAVKYKRSEKSMSQVISEFQKEALKSYRFIDAKLEKQTFEYLVDQIYKESGKTGLFKYPGKFGSFETGLKAEMRKKLLKSKMFDTAYLGKMIHQQPEKLILSQDPLVLICLDMHGIESTVGQNWQQTALKLNSLMPQYIGLREQFLKSKFIPDANSTLRLTYGYVRGYSPNDGESHSPFTTLEGIFEKANTKEDYRLPQHIQDKLTKKEVPTIFKDPKTGKVIVGFLYNMDTTGGNSGSPVLNDKGELIGINFDRSFTATINDFAWNEQYSRSIGCDIRYVLYVLKYVSEADHILKELNFEIQ